MVQNGTLAFREAEAAEPACRQHKFTGAEMQYLHQSAEFAAAAIVRIPRA